MSYLTDILPHSGSDDNEWVQFHKALLWEGFSQGEANNIWLRAWNARASDDANTHYLRNYFDTQGIDISGGVISNLTDNVRNGFSGIGTGISSFGSLVLIGAIIGVAIIGFISYKAIKN